MKLLYFLILVALLTATAFAGEKGGNGDTSTDELILNQFQLGSMCPISKPVALCEKIELEIEREYVNVSTPPTSEMPKDPDEMRNRKDFFYTCCSDELN